MALLAVALLLLTVFGGLALADPSEPEPDAALPTSQEVRESIESANPTAPIQLTNPEAAEGADLEGLSRSEALALLDGVFSRQIEAPAGMFDGFQVDRFLSPSVAVVGGDFVEELSEEEMTLPAESTEASGEEEAEGDSVEWVPPFVERSTEPGAASDPEPSGAALLDSTIPLQREAEAGGVEPIDLSLKRVDGVLLPSAPLVDVEFPEDLGDGIDLPGAGIHVDLPDAAAGSSPSIVGNTVAFYPNVSEDTDFAVSPSPKGFETLTQLRGPNAPSVEEFDLEIPQGASLRPSDSGGAEVVEDGELIMSVDAPVALDAEGADVPVQLAVADTSLILTVDPGSSAKYPILVDPLFQTYEWDTKDTDAGICSSSFGPTPPGDCAHQEEWGFKVVEHNWGGLPHLAVKVGNSVQHGIRIYAQGQQEAGNNATVFYTVPRYFKDAAPPTSYIKRFQLSDLTWTALSPSPSPYLFAGIWDPFKPAWVKTYYSHTGQVGHGTNDPAFVYDFKNEEIISGKVQTNTNGKVAQVSINATENTANSNANVYAGYAQIELGDDIPPQAPVPTPQTKWVNETAPPVQFTVGDSGLGVFAITASTEEVGTNGQPLGTWKASNGCVGVGNSACPPSWSSSEAKQPLTYDPKVLPTGIRYLKLIAEDPIGNKSAGSWAEVRVDHTAPEVALSGSITEQAALGTRRNSYTLKAAGVDGNAAKPQSGIATAIVKLDGATVPMEGAQLAQWSPKCATSNCPLSAEWTLDSSSVAAGKHTVEVIATDAAGVSSAPQKLTIEIRPAPAPSLTLGGSMTEQGTLGTTRPRYTLKAKSVASSGGIETPDLGADPLYTSSVGSLGTGPGQFTGVADVATDTKGNLWALDKESHRLQKFNDKGEFLLTTGSSGSGAGKMFSPSALALDNSGNVWIADTGNHRVVEFKENGEFLRAFGTNVNKTKVEAGGTQAEKNLCTAASGNVCQAATAGSAAGQLKSPQGIVVTPTNTIWVVDTGNGRLEKFDMSGTYISALSSEGTEPGKLKEPKAITIAPDGSLWVADYGNNRIQQWSGSSFVRAVGKEGTGGGEFKGPAAIEADSTGNIWVGDQKNNRVLAFAEGGKYLGQFGAEGSGKLSLSVPMGIAVDSLGSIWVTDAGHFKVQKWTQEVPRSEVTTTIWLDGSQKMSLRGGCRTSSCTIEPEWTLQSLSAATGSHTARVKATDGLGRSSENTVNFQIARDTTKPTLEASGELVNAPEGWVEQETYGLSATATDVGFGVTSVVFKIDGQQVASISQSCEDGACNGTLSKQISMATYAGGSHSAELVATDGANNSSAKQWTINVNPDGQISTNEAKTTLEAVESTTEETPIASNEELLEPEQMEFGDNPELQQAGSKITSTGVPTLTEMTTNPAAGFTITSPYGETTIAPVATEPSTTSIVEGVASVSTNSSSQADTVIRPEYNGVVVFQAIRSEASPEKYSWTVPLYGGQVLQLADSDHAEVLYSGGKRAFLITAEEAHDATGKEVPTSLEVSGNVLTLKVDFHSGPFVYPILAGAGWETSYEVPVLIEGPEDELEIEERERTEQEEEAPAPPPPASGYFSEAEAKKVIASGGVGQEIIPAPDPPASGEASASTVPEKVVTPYRLCAELGCGLWWVEMKNPSYHYKRNANGRMVSYWQKGTHLYSEAWYPWYYWPELTADSCGNGFTGPEKVWAGEHKHLTIWARFKITAVAFLYTGDYLDFENREALQIWVWPNGFQQRVHNPWEVTQQWIESGGQCAL